MSRPTELWFKAGVCKAVVNNLKERGYKPQRREYLEGIKDVDKAYVIANRYIRNYIPLDDKKVKKEFWKEVREQTEKDDTFTQKVYDDLDSLYRSKDISDNISIKELENIIGKKLR